MCPSPQIRKQDVETQACSATEKNEMVCMCDREIETHIFFVLKNLR